MSELERLLINRYSVVKTNGKMVATEDPNGNYRASNATEVETALSTQSITDVEVLIGGNWSTLGVKNKLRRDLNRLPRTAEYLRGYNNGYAAGRNVVSAPALGDLREWIANLIAEFKYSDSWMGLTESEKKDSLFLADQILALLYGKE